MQHRQCTQSALFGVTTVVAPKRVPTPTNGVFPASPTKNTGKQKFLQQSKTTTWSKDEPVKLSLQLSTPLRPQTLPGRVSSPSPPTLRWRSNGGVVKAANELRGIFQTRLDVHNLAARFDGLLQDCHPPSDVDLHLVPASFCVIRPCVVRTTTSKHVTQRREGQAAHAAIMLQFSKVGEIKN